MHRCVWLQVLILVLIGGYVLSQEVCSKKAVNSCGDCIKSGPHCVWCKGKDFTKPGEQDAVRCDTRAQLTGRGCNENDIISPNSTLHKVRDKPLSKTGSTHPEPIQLRPQEIKLELRPGLPQTFELTFKRADGYPVDLYYLMDLSYSMKDDLKNVKSLGEALLDALNAITGKANARIGFGSFVDKTVLPFTDTNPAKLLKPCPEKETSCQAAFGYRHVLPLTNENAKFQNTVSKQRISGNLDTPEGGLDAIMQAAVCGDKIGWGNSTRLLVLTTDAGFHMAGDGKLAAILEPNDEKCHLDTNNMYSKSNNMDYPSVGQVAMKLAENNIQPIFAVTQNVMHVYTELSKLIPKSEVGVLSANSDNVVKLIKDAYTKLSSNVIVTHDDLPENIKVTYSNCRGAGKPGEKGSCDNVGIGQEVKFSVTVTAEDCMESKSFQIGPLGFREKMTVTVKTRCECQCDDPVDKANQYCSGKGQLICGTCSCEPGFLGQKCECNLGSKDKSALKEACRRDNGTECEGRGDCVCGVCECHAIEGGSTYYGAHCECDDEHCEKFANKLCGGNGKCNCGICKCNEDYDGSACQCKKSKKECMTGETVCHGRGDCECGQCKCKKEYKGPFCQTCHTCPDPCKTYKSCIECLGFQTGPYSKNCTESCSNHIQHNMVDTLTTRDSKKCIEKDTENCKMIFTMTERDGFDKYTANIQKTRECPQPPNIGAIIGGSLAGVALIGILILLLIKALIWMNDRKEWKKFEKEQKRSKWTDGNNPLFQKATTTVQNPTFSGE